MTAKEGAKIGSASHGHQLIPGQYLLVSRTPEGKDKYRLVSNEDAAKIKIGMLKDPELGQGSSMALISYSGKVNITVSPGTTFTLEDKIVQRAIVQAKLLTGKVSFKKEELALLREIIGNDQVVARNLKKMVESKLVYMPESSKQNQASSLRKLFTTLNPVADIEKLSEEEKVEYATAISKGIFTLKSSRFKGYFSSEDAFGSGDYSYQYGSEVRGISAKNDGLTTARLYRGRNEDSLQINGKTVFDRYGNVTVDDVVLKAAMGVVVCCEKGRDDNTQKLAHCGLALADILSKRRARLGYNQHDPVNKDIEKVIENMVEDLLSVVRGGKVPTALMKAVAKDGTFRKQLQVVAKQSPLFVADLEVVLINIARLTPNK